MSGAALAVGDVATRPRTTTSRVLAMFAVARPATSVTAALLAVAGVRLGGEGAAGSSPLVVADLALGWFLLACGSFAINDAFDAEIDAIVHPSRPIPSGRLTRRESATLGVTLALIGSLVLSFAAPPLGLVGLTYGVAAWAYSARVTTSSGLLANAMTAAAVALVPASSAALGAPLVALIWAVSAIFLGVLAREVLNDLEDADGDRVYGRPTLALTLGPTHAMRVTVVAWMAFVAAAWMPGVLSNAWRDPGYLAAMLPLTLAAGYVAVAAAGAPPSGLPRLQLASKLVLVAFGMAAVGAPGWFR